MLLAHGSQNRRTGRRYRCFWSILLGLLMQIFCGMSYAQTLGWVWDPAYISPGVYQTAQQACDAMLDDTIKLNGPYEWTYPMSIKYEGLNPAGDVIDDCSATWYDGTPYVIGDVVQSEPYLYNPAKNLGDGCNCDGGSGTASDAGTNTPEMVGEPINIGVGNEHSQQTDFDGQSWLRFRRFYNSSETVASAHIGANWRDSFDRSIELSDSPLTTISTLRPDGRQDTFTKANGIWTSDADVSDKLTEQDDANGNLIGFILFVAGSRQFEDYSATGALQSISDESGLTETFIYTDGSQKSVSGSALAAGLLWTVTDPYGRTLAFSYSGLSIVAVTQPDGGVLSYGYDSSGNLASVKYPDGKQRQYLYDEAAYSAAGDLQSKLTGVIDESGARFTTIGYQKDGRAISSQEGAGTNLYSISYASSGTATTVTYPLGQQATATFVAPQGTSVLNALSARCGEQCGQQYQSRTLDANGYPARTIDFNGNITATTYDSNGLLDQQVDASGTSSQRTTTTTWNTTLRVPLTHTVSNASAAVVSNTQWVYNTIGQALARCDIDPTNSAASGYTCAATGTVPAGVRRSIYTYCTAIDTVQCPLVGLMLTATGPRTDLTQTTTYSYYMAASAVNCGTPGAACHQVGDLYQITDALGRTTTYNSYDGAGRVTRITDDANSVNTDMTYTPRGWLATRTVGGAVTTFGYDAMGDVKSIEDPSGITTTFTYDAAHRLTDITDAEGNDIHYTLDAAGNKTSEQTRTASGTVVRSLSRQFNTLGQLTALIDGLNKTVLNASYNDSYDANGNLTHTADALGFQREISFDALNRLNTTIDNYNGTDTATANTKTVVTKDALDRVVGVVDPNNLNTVPTYDGLSDRTKLQSPDTGTSTDTFDAAGNRLVHTDAKGVVSTSTYDALNRLTATSYSDTTLNVAYHYDDANSVTGCTSSWPVGRLTRVVENSVTTTYCYNSRGKVLQKKQATSSITDTTTYTYTSADRLSKVSTPDGTAITYAFNSDGLPSSVTVTPSGTSSSPPTVVSAITWLPFGPISSYTLGNGQTVTRTYDANYRATDIVSLGFTLHLARDVMGKVSAIGNAAGANPATETYTYDPLYRLSSVTDAGAALESYTYNQTGDRLSKTASGLETGAYLYTTGTHQISKIGTNTRASDANGNTTGSTVGGGNTYGFSYNGRNRESLAQLNGATVGTYTYNAMGQRIGKVAASTERYSYDQANNLIGEYGTTNRDYIWVGNLPVAVIDNVISGGVTTSTVNYITADQLNTPRAVTNSAGTVIWSWAYQGNPFGEQAPTSSTGYVLNLRYPGQYYDAETATNYNLFRNYEPAIGRYQESDPTGLAGGISTFAYVAGNSLNLVDPNGLDPCPGTLPVVPTITPVGTLPNVPTIVAVAPGTPTLTMLPTPDADATGVPALPLSEAGPKEVSPEAIGGAIGAGVGGALGTPLGPYGIGLGAAGGAYLGSYIGDNFDNPNSYIPMVIQNTAPGSAASTHAIEND